jgi:hypothetical protein
MNHLVSNSDVVTPTPHRLVSEVFARYVRAADNRDPDAMRSVFWENATVSVVYRGEGDPQMLAELTGSATIATAVTTAMAPHAPRNRSHHTTVNPLVSVAGDTARFDAQFIVYNARGAARPASGWPADAVGAQGVITPIECGYLQADLRFHDREWRISHLRIEHDLPYAFPAQ